jgi:nucleotidyltransferase substrate binding protein (TIGR01987 family)
MMNDPDVRWQQRFQNYAKVLSLLEAALGISTPDITQQAGIIQFFEMSSELAWKLLKDYLESQGFQEIKSPRGTLKKAFEVALIADGHRWLQLLTDHNLTAYTYDEAKAEEVVRLIRTSYFPLLKTLHDDFQARSTG